MLLTIRGHVENGQIIPDEIPTVQNGTDVIITFLTKKNQPASNGKRMLGILNGQINIPQNFNDQLEDFDEG